MKKVICDTNIFIHYFEGDKATQAEIRKIGLENVLLPSIVAMELFRGMSNKNEMARMKSRIKYFNFLHFNNAVSETGQSLIENYHLSHDLQIPDAIIGAMSIVYDLPLFTYNIKDFRYLPKLKLYL